MNQKSASIIITIGLVIVAVIAGYFIGSRQNFSQKPTREINSFEECVEAGYPVAESYPRQCQTPDGRNFVEELTGGTGRVCTQEAKQCPNGSYVSRTGPNCEFAPCPESEQENASQISLKEGQRESSLLVEKIYTDRIIGLNFPEYPISLEKGLPITLHIGETASNGCTVTLKLIRIESDVAIFIKKTKLNRPCPICLSGNTLIETPSGSVPIKDLQIGMLVWTMDKTGQRISGIITKTSKVQVPPMHKMVHLVLNDGRELFVSPGHPTIDGRTIVDLRNGDLYDSAYIVSIESISYGEDATYDILPSGETGFYWANGILIGSTLR